MGRLKGTNNISIGVFPGGGTQGLISAYTAAAFAKKSGRPFHESFDQIEGLSVGSLNAAALWPLEATGQPLMSPEDLKQTYLNDIDDAFKYNIWSLGGLFGTKYDIKGLEKLIDRIYGGHKLSDYKDGLHIYVVDVETKEIRVLKSEDAKVSPENDFYMRDLLRAAVAAPLYFKPVEIHNMAGRAMHFVDGGLFTSDPSFKAYFDASQSHGRSSRIAVTTFATGHKNHENITMDELDGGLTKGQHMLSVLFKSKANTFDQMMKDAIGDNYVRMDVDLSDSGIDMIARRISDVVPYAQQAVLNNQKKIIWALNNIERIRYEEPESCGFEVSDTDLPDNVIRFTPAESGPLAAYG